MAYCTAALGRKYTYENERWETPRSWYSVPSHSGPKYLTGARHFLNDIYPHFNTSHAHLLVKSATRGSKKICADPVCRKLPLRLHHLTIFLNVAWRSSSYDDLLFVTILSCLFYACHHSGELVQNNDWSLFDWKKVIKRASLHFTDGRAQYCLPYHKGDPFYCGTDVLLGKHDIADPVSLLQEYVLLCDSKHSSSPALFLHENSNHPTCSWFEANFFAVLNHSFGGHSAWAGGATYYASLGLCKDIIQALGCWSSSAWKIYIRENPTIHAERQLTALRHHCHGPAHNNHWLLIPMSLTFSSPPPPPTHIILRSLL